MRGTQFIDPLVVALLEGRKTVTRRRMRRQPHGCLYFGPPYPGRWWDGTNSPIPAPPGHDGETQYIREAYAPAADGSTLYRATHEGPAPDRWRPGFLMPEHRARIWIRVVDVRPIRLRILDDAEALREGIESAEAFREGWDRLHADHPDVLWAADPWVWRMEFVRCERPEIG